MSDYRINVRFHADVPAEKKAAEYLQTLNKSRNKFIVDAVIAYMNKESANNETPCGYAAFHQADSSR